MGQYPQETRKKFRQRLELDRVSCSQQWCKPHPNYLHLPRQWIQLKATLLKTKSYPANEAQGMYANKNSPANCGAVFLLQSIWSSLSAPK